MDTFGKLWHGADQHTYTPGGYGTTDPHGTLFWVPFPKVRDAGGPADPDQVLYQRMRRNMQEPITFKATLPAGTYTVRLLTADIECRFMNCRLEGATANGIAAQVNNQSIWDVNYWGRRVAAEVDVPGVVVGGDGLLTVVVTGTKGGAQLNAIGVQ